MSASAGRRSPSPVPAIGKGPLPNGCPRTAHALGRSFRCGVHAASGGDEAALAFAWQELADSAGAEHADRLLAALIGFVETVETTAQRPIVVLPRACAGLCRDECLAVSIVTASQAGACPALKACAFALLASADVEPCLTAARELGDRLKDAGRTLPSTLICNAAAFVDPTGGSRH
ncbi:MAG: hypothetical protein NW216_05345 [Hyphomicrobium sp.]|nr:hypothetical protein [Hyphomicrobium sp.]